MERTTHLWTKAINHDGYTETWITTSAKAGDFLPVGSTIDVEPGGQRQIKVWFMSTDTPAIGVLRVRGRMQVRTAEGVAISAPFYVEIHSDSQEMHYVKSGGV